MSVTKQWNGRRQDRPEGCDEDEGGRRQLLLLQARDPAGKNATPTYSSEIDNRNSFNYAKFMFLTTADTPFELPLKHNLAQRELQNSVTRGAEY